ncbi:uncharacterized protein LOC131078811 isoform X2 [Cryptomeria japonica]|uniref:uncharacterized protein LOC131078811 isoform X2 n=1 Tax=Cryptomeria japonica TaxID=3369 RepID=UPI0025AB74AE|nr:uncharacterized protein LOC131078811 isoform X2 [Cryptomeria japonica]
MKRMKAALQGLSEEESLPSYEDFQPLETREQVKMVESFEKSHALQNAVWRGIFSIFLFSFAGFFIYSAHRQSLSPWDVRYHAYFMDEVDSRTVIIADWMAAISFLMAIVGLLWKSKFHVYWLLSSSAIGLLLACFWMYHMLSCGGLCVYVDRLLSEALEDIKRLRASIYHFKRI